MPNIAYVNGKWGPLSSAAVSVEDRGFQFGDGVYEVIRTYGASIFHLDEHIKRLDESTRQVQITLPQSPATLEKIIRSGCKKSGYFDVKIYIQITRGVAPRLHPFPKGIDPTVVMTFREFDPLSPATRKKGIAAISVEDIRWSRCNIKSLNLLPNVLAREQGLQAGAYETVFVRNRFAWEGAGSNLFAIFGKKIVTPPKGPYLLSGVTREVTLKLTPPKGFSMIEKKILLADLYRADEVFITGTTIEILPVVRLDEKKIGTGKPGETTRLLSQAFQREVLEK
jgi:D-alanine transaminase